MSKGLVSKIIPFSSVDGPGNRMAIFLQGCNFNCLYCHNPETINLCNNCGQCVDECPYSALERQEGKVIWHKDLCQECDLCLRVCQTNSKPKAVEMTVADIVAEINKVKPFLSGITVSGGECTLQLDFLIKLFKQVKKMGLTVFIDTNGYIPLTEAKELIDIMDMAMVDVKSYSPQEHKMLTGRDNGLVLANVKYLASINKLYEVRTVIVPEILDNYYNVDNISRMIVALNPHIRYKLIKYRDIGVRKDKINSYTPSDELMGRLANLARENGCKNVVCV